ncbi:hypothetical protein [Leifsonia soli]|uniref:Uncharacterized protein n=1 Tax=Leifsonia soli TaxID=582665 RepID=A0A852SZK8_9MICO|nr:hypothetical protein [Leifsonia soli]NYD74042.1 hypothetical protein [Leifsonia soli]
MRIRSSVLAAGVALLALSGCTTTESPAPTVSAAPSATSSASPATPRATAPIETSDEATTTCWNAYAAQRSAAPDRRALAKSDFSPTADGFDVTLTIQSGETQNADGSTSPIFDIASCSLNRDGTLGKVSVKVGS